MREYEIWWAELPKPAGRRPVLLLSRDDAYALLNKFVAAEITATVRHIPIEVSLGMTSTVHLVKKIAKLSPTRVYEVNGAIGYALGWEELIAAE